MPQYRPTLTNSAFPPAPVRAIGPGHRNARGRAPLTYAEDRLPPAIAIRIIALSALGLWLLIWRLVATLAGG